MFCAVSNAELLLICTAEMVYFEVGEERGEKEKGYRRLWRGPNAILNCGSCESIGDPL